MTRPYAAPTASGPLQGPRASRYAQAEDMLERYGLAYVCSHPSILFGRLALSQSDVSDILAGSYRPLASTALREAYPSPPAKRIAEAYRILQYFYAPYRPRG